LSPAPFLLALALAAPPEGTPQERAPAPEVHPDEEGHPDIVLHVPRAEVGKLSLDVENLEARLDVNTRVANLVEIEAGVVANVGKLKMQLEEVASEARLVVRLERVARIMERALGTLDRNPDLDGLPPSARTAPRSVPPAEPVPVGADAPPPPASNPVQE
jgi:hypothetical protein